MASVDMQMSAIGVEPPCEGCDKKWQRGERMNAVLSFDNEPMGWFCDECIRTWNQQVVTAKG